MSVHLVRAKAASVKRQQAQAPAASNKLQASSTKILKKPDARFKLQAASGKLQATSGKLLDPFTLIKFYGPGTEGLY